MLKSCQYCGKIHDKSYDCGKRPEPKKRYSNQNSFRNTAVWKKKAVEIKQRDMYLCRICLAAGRLSGNNLEVHHITPLEVDYDMRLENENLLTVCRSHHEQCESGKIDRDYQRELASGLVEVPPHF